MAAALEQRLGSVDARLDSLNTIRRLGLAKSRAENEVREAYNIIQWMLREIDQNKALIARLGGVETHTDDWPAYEALLNERHALFAQTRALHQTPRRREVYFAMDVWALGDLIGEWAGDWAALRDGLAYLRGDNWQDSTFQIETETERMHYCELRIREMQQAYAAKAPGATVPGPCPALFQQGGLIASGRAAGDD